LNDYARAPKSSLTLAATHDPRLAESFDNRVTPEERTPAKEGDGPSESAAAPAQPAPLTLEAALLEDAHDDAREVLGDEECGDFYGGTEKAQHILSRLVQTLRAVEDRDPLLGIRMGGEYVRIDDYPTGASFRLFEESVVNLNGPFFRERHAGKPLPRCGSFAPGTRAARAAMLLHELGHLVRDAAGKWLLPNDGRDPAQSLLNTRLVERKCGKGLKALDGRKSLPARLAGVQRKPR